MQHLTLGGGGGGYPGFLFTNGQSVMYVHIYTVQVACTYAQRVMCAVHVEKKLGNYIWPLASAQWCCKLACNACVVNLTSHLMEAAAADRSLQSALMIQGIVISVNS